jgi:hypothetical protein
MSHPAPPGADLTPALSAKASGRPLTFQQWTLGTSPGSFTVLRL